MSEVYFYQERGKTVGPYNADDIKGRIKDGRIRVFDLVYKDGEPSWRMALEHASLRAEFKSTTLSTLRERPWICLQKKTDSLTDFTTTGPWNQVEIREQIQTGKISYSDYAWKDSFSEWRRIGALEEFNPRARNSELPPVPEVRQETVTDFLRDVVTVTKSDPNASKPYLVPPEADSHDYASGQPPPPPAASAKSAPVIIAKAAPLELETITPASSQIRIKSETRAEGKETKKRKQKPQPWLDWSMVGVLVMVLAGVVLIVSRFIPRTPKMIERETVQTEPIAKPAPPAPPPPIPVAQPQPVAQVQPEPVAAPPPVPTAPKAPRELRIQIQAGPPPRIDIRTDGTKEFPVLVQVVGLAGQVSEGGAYYRLMKVTPPGNNKEPLNLAGMRLPQGKFIVRAEAGEIKKEAKFAWGLNDPQYKAIMGRQRKSWAYAIWQERLALLKLSQALEKQVSQALLPGKRFNSRPWEPLIALKRGEGFKHLMFEDWWELHNIAKEAKAGVSGGLVTRAQKERERLANFSVWK